MKSASHQVQDLAIQPKTTFDPRVKCVLMAAYQNDGKTVLKPLMSGQNAKTVADLFNNKTLEVWLSNGENEFLQFDVDILKYRQVLQPLTKCQELKTRTCLRNLFENLVSCEQIVRTGEIADDKY